MEIVRRRREEVMRIVRGRGDGGLRENKKKDELTLVFDRLNSRDTTHQADLGRAIFGFV